MDPSWDLDNEVDGLRANIGRMKGVRKKRAPATTSEAKLNRTSKVCSLLASAFSLSLSHETLKTGKAH